MIECHRQLSMVMVVGILFAGVMGYSECCAIFLVGAYFCCIIIYWMRVDYIYRRGYGFVYWQI